MKQKKEIKVIPPDPKYDKSVRVEKKILNVAAYCRVSTRQEHQENSFEPLETRQNVRMEQTKKNQQSSQQSNHISAKKTTLNKKKGRKK